MYAHNLRCVVPCLFFVCVVRLQALRGFAKAVCLPSGSLALVSPAQHSSAAASSWPGDSSLLSGSEPSVWTPHPEAYAHGQHLLRNCIQGCRRRVQEEGRAAAGAGASVICQPCGPVRAQRVQRCVCDWGQAALLVSSRRRSQPPAMPRANSSASSVSLQLILIVCVGWFDVICCSNGLARLF